MPKIKGVGPTLYGMAALSSDFVMPFVMPKVGEIVWYYFEHAFWDVPLENYGEIKRWRFTGRTELRARQARILHVDGNGSSVVLAPEYAPDDRVKFMVYGLVAVLAHARISAYVHMHLKNADATRIYGRIVDGILPEANHWGYDPLPAIGGGR